MRAFFIELREPLLELGFLVEDMLARLGIVLLDLQLVRRGALVFGRGVEVAGAGARLELDLLAHGRPPSPASLRLSPWRGSRPIPPRRRPCRSCAGRRWRHADARSGS